MVVAKDYCDFCDFFCFQCHYPNTSVGLVVSPMLDKQVIIWICKTKYDLTNINLKLCRVPDSFHMYPNAQKGVNLYNKLKVCTRRNNKLLM